MLVAVIALVGVLITTWWNNRAADRRRIADQVAADTRRKADQEAEDDRRREEDARRERERREQLQREDCERQLRAVADCVSEITKTAALVGERATSVCLHGDGDVEQAQLVKAVQLMRFNVEVTSHLTLLDIQITQPHVRAVLRRFWNQVVSDYQPLLEAQNRGGQAWMEQAERMPPLSDTALEEIRKLTIVARLALLEYPEHFAKRGDLPMDLEELYKSEHTEYDNDAK